MTNLIDCVRCHRRGLRDYVVHPDGETTGWVCSHTAACLRRKRDAQAAPTSDPSATSGAAGAVSADAVAGLAREVEELRRTVEPVTELRNQLDEYERALQDIAVKLDELGAKKPQQLPAPSWLTLPGNAESTGGVLTDLVEWLGAVFLRYTDGAAVLPECWLWHPDVVEELVWLSHAWKLAGDWHDRYRPGVVTRLKGLAGNCSLERHQTRGGHSPVGAPVVPITDALDAIADWWATHRAEAAPEPTDEHLAAADRLPRQGGRR